MSQFEITSMNPVDIKERLKAFIESKDAFTDHNFEGSALSVILDLLTRNTYYSSFMANMLANESFLESAQLRQTVVSHARRLGYIPRSKSSAFVDLNLKVHPVDTVGIPSTLNMLKDKQFYTKVDGKIYTFVNNVPYTLYKDVDGNYVVDDVRVYQGVLVTNEFQFDVGGTGIFEIPNKDIDTKTLSVSVRSNKASTISVPYTLVSDITELDGSSDVYFLYENSRGYYQIEFGDGVLGKELSDKNYIVVEYVNNSDDIHCNGATLFSAASSVGGYSNIDITAQSIATGGEDKEGIESIRKTAPNSFARQKRAVTPDDYATLLVEDYPFVKSAHGWSGDENPEPAYGKTFIAVVPVGGFNISQTIKDIIVNSVLKKYKVGPIVPVIVGATVIKLDLSVYIDFNQSSSSENFQTTSTQISDLISQYSKDNLEAFAKKYSRSKLEREILNDIAGVDSVSIETIMFRDFDPIFNTKDNVTFSFLNQIEEGSVFIDNVLFSNYPVGVNDRAYIKDVNGVLVAYKNSSGSDSVLIPSVGSVDYVGGDIKLQAVTFKANSINEVYNKYKIQCKPKKADIEIEREYIVNIDSSKVYSS